MDDQDEVVKWTSIASAFHGGALDHCNTFGSTHDAISYLYSYRGREHEDRASVISRRHHDFYYNVNNVPGPVGLSRFFESGVADPCLLCRYTKVTLDGDRFWCAREVPANDYPRTMPDGDLDLRRLQHLAVMHTPYFVMLFVQLVQDKRYRFHGTDNARYSIANHVFGKLRASDNARVHRGQGSSNFLQLWWRVQDKRGSRELNVAIPWYLELHTGNNVWNPRVDSFAHRKPEPLYSFLSTTCLIHDMWSDGATAYSAYGDLSPRTNVLTEGRVSTSSLSVLIPRSHLEDVLHSAVRACKSRQAVPSLEGTGWANATDTQRSAAGLPRSREVVPYKQMECSHPLEPRLDCIVLEDVGHARAVMMHVVTTLDSRWQTLGSWMASLRGRTLDERLDFIINKVFLGVMGSLRHMCLLDKRPPRDLYTGTASREPKLATAFFIHGETGDVLSLLPFVSLPILYRSSNIPEDECAFRRACAFLALRMLYVYAEDNDFAFHKLQALTHWWEAGGSSSRHLGLREPCVDSATAYNAYTFCRTGLLDDDIWSALGPVEAGSRDMSKVDVPDVWLGETSRTPEALMDRLLALGFQEPLRVSVIESIVGRPRRGLAAFSPPEMHQGLISMLTADANVLFGNALSSNTSVVGVAYTPRVMTSYSAMRYAHHKRSNDNLSVSLVAQKKMHSEDAVEPSGLRYMKELSRTVGQQLARCSSSSSSAETPTKIYLDVQNGSNDTAEVNRKMVSHDEPLGDIRTVVITDDHLMVYGGSGGEMFNGDGSFGELDQCGNVTADTQRTVDDTGLFRVRTEYTSDSNWSNTSGKYLQSDIDPFGSNADAFSTDNLAGGSQVQTGIDVLRLNSFDHQYIIDPQTHNRLVDENLRAVNTGDLCGQSQFPYPSRNRPQPMPQIQSPYPSHGQLRSQLHQRINRVAEQPAQDSTGVQLYPQPREPLVTTAQPVHSDRHREATVQEAEVLNRNKRWKSVGFTNDDLRILDVMPYQKMYYLTCDAISGRRLKDTRIQTIPTNAGPITNPCAGLVEPPQRNGWVKPTDLSTTVGVVRTDPRDHKISWEIGVESDVSRNSTLCYPKRLAYNKKIPCSTLSCEKDPQTYDTVNLAMPPCNGFKHVELMVSEFPTMYKEQASNLLMIKSKKTYYLGAVCTIEDMRGVLVHKVFVEDANLLYTILDMHTSLQVHPFVPRTFTLQLMKTPYFHKSAVGMFVGEAVGDWNLGCASGMYMLAKTEKFTLAYHILQCLLRVQILSIRVLGFTMKCIQPARIWKWNNGFRADFIGCLIDTIFEWQDEDPVWRDLGGLATIARTMQQLELFIYLPAELRDMLMEAHELVFGKDKKRRKGQPRRCHAGILFDPSDVHLLQNVYNMCAFTEQTHWVSNDLNTILGSDEHQYKRIQLFTKGLVVEPYGPFRIQVHNQIFKWNKAIIVEPVLDRSPELAQVSHIFAPSKPAAGKAGYAKEAVVAEAGASNPELSCGTTRPALPAPSAVSAATSGNVCRRGRHSVAAVTGHRHSTVAVGVGPPGACGEDPNWSYCQGAILYPGTPLASDNSMYYDI